MATDKDFEVAGKGYDTAASPVRRPEFNEYHDIIRDPEFDGLTLYEKKALLVNRELDSHGMGKYQWWIFFLCGFGYVARKTRSHTIANVDEIVWDRYFLDLMWAQAFGLVATPLQNELGFPSTYTAYLPGRSRLDRFVDQE